MIAYLMVASHGIGLVRAWELLGAPRQGLLAWVSPLYELNRGRGASGQRAQRDAAPLQQTPERKAT
jgi:hypothetical protein